jgi:hypothetical protein
MRTQHTLPYRAIVVFDDGTDRSCSCDSELQAARFFDRMAMVYGFEHIFATYVDNERMNDHG